MKRACLLALLALSSCAIFASPIPSKRELRIGEVREPELVERVTRHPHTGVVLRTWSEWLLPSGEVERHGREQTWYASGAKEWEREFDHGRPVGHWRGWYEDGTLMAESFHNTDHPTRMSFWHPNGQLSGEGLAWNGVRTGPWSHWYVDGSVREQGEYVEGLRDGRWIFLFEDGSLEARGEYAAGARIGEWELYETPHARSAAGK